MADNEKAIGYETQSGFGTPNLPTAPQYAVRGFGEALRVENDSPHYATNTAYNQTRIRRKTRGGTYHVDLDVTPDNLSPLVESNLGPAVAGVSKAGVGDPVYLSVREAEGLAQNWQGADARVNVLELTFNLMDGLQASADLLGPPPALVTSAWTTPAPIPTSLVPFDAWQVFITKGGAAYCVRRMRVRNDQKLDPLYCSQATEPDNTTEAGLAPTRYTRGEGEVAVEIEAQYLGDSGSEYEAFRLGNNSLAWTIVALDPSTGGTARVEITIPVLGYTEGELQRESVNWQHMTGLALYSATDGSPLIITITP